MFYSSLKSPIGELLLVGNGKQLYRIYFANQQQGLNINNWQRSHSIFTEVKNQLTAYFAGELMRFDLPIYQPGTDFQQTVWNALQSIPYGQTRSYSDIANQIG